mmetsp:Transcript_174/g.362  ORF Transcript_174/g.362 Transcript_174/m.362 type:complete len:240 (-) Transcript_174:549-1268(-)
MHRSVDPSGRFVLLASPRGRNNSYQPARCCQPAVVFVRGRLLCVGGRRRRRRQRLFFGLERSCLPAGALRTIGVRGGCRRCHRRRVGVATRTRRRLFQRRPRLQKIRRSGQAEGDRAQGPGGDAPFDGGHRHDGHLQPSPVLRRESELLLDDRRRIAGGPAAVRCRLFDRPVGASFGRNGAHEGSREGGRGVRARPGRCRWRRLRAGQGDRFLPVFPVRGTQEGLHRRPRVCRGQQQQK